MMQAAFFRPRAGYFARRLAFFAEIPYNIDVKNRQRVGRSRTDLFSLQRAGMWKRISAFLFDFILGGVAATLFAFLLSGLLGYDGYVDTLEAAYAAYGEQYDVDFHMSLSDHDALTEADSARLDEAYKALGQDERAVYAYGMIMRLTILILSMSLLLSCLLIEFVVPLLLHDGRTLGKRIFSLGVMRADGVRISAVTLFIRSILGKYTIELMVPALILLMLYFGSLGLFGTLALAGLALVQLVLFLATHEHTPIHDLLAGTVVIDYPSQKIFASREELIAFKQQQHAQQVASERA